jgi:hypothetical protein
MGRENWTIFNGNSIATVDEYTEVIMSLRSFSEKGPPE